MDWVGGDAGDIIWVDGYVGGCFSGNEVKDKDKAGQVFKGPLNEKCRSLLPCAYE